MRASRCASWAATALLLAGGGCLNGGDRWVRFTDVQWQGPVDGAVTTLVLENRVGDLRITPGPTGQVRVRAEVSMEARRAATESKGTFTDYVVVSSAGNTLTITDAGLNRADCRHWHVAISIELPPGMTLIRATNGVGDIRVDPAGAGVALKGGVGDIAVRGASAGEISVESGTGDVRITVPDVKAAIRTRSGVGQTRIDVGSVGGPVNISGGTGDISFTVSGLPLSHEVRVSSGVGNISLRLPETAVGRFDLASGVGGVRVDRVLDSSKGISHMKGNNIQLTTGVDGPLYHVRSGTGQIQVQ